MQPSGVDFPANRLTTANLLQLTHDQQLLTPPRRSSRALETFVHEQRQTTYTPRAPSLSPMVHSQDRILAEQRQSEREHVVLRHDVDERATGQHALNTRPVGLTTSMKSKAGQTDSANICDIAQRLQQRRDRRRRKRLIVQDRSKSLSARLRDAQGTRGGAENIAKGVRNPAGLLGRTADAYRPSTKMTSGRLTMVSRACPEVF